ncbi:hypothetical protein ES319_A11G345800v1 [Gossypium barbadense]|uniref:Uncharacterized protein n=1 Tax=Gossypium barbadense TaxID=3634 RepID=A0A5J5TWK8_GOSBA|nr:hypothetical protein ES319_A11G345800v1 [Gossypium barbadense]
MRNTIKLKNPFGFRPPILGGGFLDRPQCWKIEHQQTVVEACATW